MATLIVYAELPEEVKFFIVLDGDLTEEDHAHLRGANNKFINSDESTDDMNWLSEKLSDDWKNCQHDMSDGHITEDITHVYYAGFIL